MIDFFFCFIISIICACGLAIIFVEKRHNFPVRYFNLHIRAFLRKYIHRKMASLLKCSVCTSFWAALITDTSMYFISDSNYFLWPLSGFAVAGITWIIIEFLNILDSQKEVI